MIRYENRTALITGASSGIGRAFAETLSSKGANVILVARSKAKLDALAAKIRRSNQVTVHVIVADLSKEDGPRRVHEATKRLRRDVDVLINNAGFGTYGPFHTIPAGEDHDEIMLNVAAVVRLTHVFLPAMLERHTGIIVNVASGAAFQAAPYMAVYGASKAFVLSFSEALWAEYRGQGISVLALCPGPTDTGFFKVARNEDAVAGRKRSPQAVVDTALRALDRGRSSAIDGGLLRLGIFSERLVSRSVVARSAAKIMAPRRAGREERFPRA